MLTERNKIRLVGIGIFLIAIFSFGLNFPDQWEKAGIKLPDFFNRPFHLGLDLQGGAHLIYQADVSQLPEADQASAVEGVRDVIEKRVNSFGVAEPVVQTAKSGDDYRLIVELAGITDVNQAISMIGETPLLEFKEENPNPQIELSEEQQQELNDYNANVQAEAESLLAQILENPDSFSQLAKDHSDDIVSGNDGGNLGFIARGMTVPEFEKTCFDDLAVGEISKNLTQTQFGYHIIKKEEVAGAGDDLSVRCSHILLQTRDESEFLEGDNLWSYTGLTGEQLKRATVTFEPSTQAPQVLLEFNDQGAEMFGTITGSNLGKRIAIFLDGEAISTPVVQSQITSGQAVISGQFTIQDAKLLAQRLNAGALPVPIELISQQTVGATLGKISIEKSLNAGLVGLILVSIFMILYYRLLGLTAVMALIVYGLLTLAVFKLIPVTLTLAGIAGFTLSLGMAVDANILIFERLKEELKKDKPLGVAVNEGFRRAWPSIYDGNISTLITCLILIGFSTSMVKGFAITLSIGILLSMFSAMVVTRVIIKLIIGFKPLTNTRLYGVKKKNN